MVPWMKPFRIGRALPTGSSNNMVLPTRLSSTRIDGLNMLSAMRSQPTDNKSLLKKSGSSSNLSQLQSSVTSSATAGALARIVPQASSTAIGSTEKPRLASLVVGSALLIFHFSSPSFSNLPPLFCGNRSL
jgi:hypothetical protein